MVTFGEPEYDPLSELTSDGKRKGGWHKKSAASWKRKQRAEAARKKKQTRPRELRPRMVGKTARMNRSAPVEYPCPKCYAPVRDGICQGAYSLANGGLHNEG